MTTATIYRNGKAIASATLSATDAATYAILADAVRRAQAALKANPTTPGTTYKAGDGFPPVGADEFHGASIYNALLRIDDLVGGHDPREVYPYLNDVVAGETLVNPDGSSTSRLKSKNTPIVAPTHAALRAIQSSGDYTALAVTLGMIPSDKLKFDGAVLTDPAAPGDGALQVRASVRWL
ncbi:MAG: hypothetical protein WBZ31_10430 [Thiobacillus sp.]